MPHVVSVPGLPAAMSRNRWAMTPCGRCPQASIALAMASFCSAGTNPQWPTNHPFYDASMPQVVEPPAAAIALTSRVVAGSGCAANPCRFRLAHPESAAPGLRATSLKSDADNPPRGHGVAIVDQPDRLYRADKLVALRAVRCGIVAVGMHPGPLWRVKAPMLTASHYCSFPVATRPRWLVASCAVCGIARG